MQKHILATEPLAPATYSRLVPLIVAVALFMENMDSTIIATSLPAIATDIGTSPLALKLALTSYLLSLAVFIPASGWTADRYGAKNVFRAAIGVFLVGSLACAAASSLEQFVGARIIQGMGGAMMTPVGRLVLVRTIDKRWLVDALAWVTVPALIGPVIGPPLGGLITTYSSWRWIFLINVPIGLIGILLVTRFFENIRAERPDRFDLKGLLLAGLGVAGLAFGLSVLGLDLLPWEVTASLVGGGAIAMGAYMLHARRVPTPALDFSLLRIPTFRASFLGGFLFRMGIGALPFLLPLLLQLGFGLTPFQSGMITFSSALGAVTMKMVASRVLNRYGFRNILIVNGLISAAFLAACSFFTPETPVPAIIALLLVGGFFRSLEFTSINVLAYADVDPLRVSRATTLASVGQQVGLSAGVAIGALAVESAMDFRGGDVIQAGDFRFAFLLVAAISALAVLLFVRLPEGAGAALTRGRRQPADAVKEPITHEVRDQRVA